MRIVVFLVSFVFCLQCCTVSSPSSINQETTKVPGISIPISWFSELNGDFSFANNWEYAKGIKINNYNQIICSECSPRAARMLDRRQKIIADSMDVFYKEVDSTRHYFSLESRCSAKDWEESNFVSVTRYGEFIIEGNTVNKGNSFCNLFFRIKDDFVTSWIYYKPEGSESTIYTLKEGKFFMDRSAFDKGILKVKFSFVFYNPENSLKALYWSGKIKSKISNF